jgi:hypothetical protein
MGTRFLAVVLSYITPPPALDDCVRFWQRHMELKEWHIQVHVVPVAQLGHGTLGDIEPRSEKTAVLRVMRHQDSNLSPRLALAEQRLTLIHEMVHLRKFVTNDGNWRSEVEVDTEVIEWVRRHRRWRESLLIER